MPFAFWKSAKGPEDRPLLSDAAVREELSVIIPPSAAVDLDTAGQDAGVFLFDEDAKEIDGVDTPVVGPAVGETGQKSEVREMSLLDACENVCQESPALVPEGVGDGGVAADREMDGLSGDVASVESSPEGRNEDTLVEPPRVNHDDFPAVEPSAGSLETSPSEASARVQENSLVEPSADIHEDSPAEASIDSRETSTPVETSTDNEEKLLVETSTDIQENPRAEPSTDSQEKILVETSTDSQKTFPPSTDTEGNPPPAENHEEVPQSRPVSLLPKESGPTLTVEKRGPAARVRVDTNIRDRDSGVYLSDSETSPARSRPSSIVSNDSSPLRSRVASLSKPSASPRAKSIARLQRPAELNLGFTAPDPAKPRSELDMRHDLIRNSKTQSKAALRSPTQLLQDRLNMSPKKKDTEKVRVFTPPRATVNGCLLPGPGAQAEAFTSTSVRAMTEAGSRPAWWCKFDKLVVFDGTDADGGLRTRTSKGLTIARRRGDLETVVIPLDCAHCHEMLNRHEWKYDIRVCKRSVCWDCKERCKWEVEQEKLSVATPRADANRERADSMLQDEQDRSNESRREIVA